MVLWLRDDTLVYVALGTRRIHAKERHDPLAFCGKGNPFDRPYDRRAVDAATVCRTCRRALLRYRADRVERVGENYLE